MCLSLLEVTSKKKHITHLIVFKEAPVNMGGRGIHTDIWMTLMITIIANISKHSIKCWVLVLNIAILKQYFIYYHNIL